jgi:hypothetical protein
VTPPPQQAYHEQLGLDFESLDQLITDDFETLSAPPPSAAHGASIAADGASSQGADAPQGGAAAGGTENGFGTPSTPGNLPEGGGEVSSVGTPAPSGAASASVAPNTTAASSGAIQPLASVLASDPRGGSSQPLGGAQPLGASGGSGGSGGSGPVDTPVLPNCNCTCSSTNNEVFAQASGAIDHSIDSQSEFSPAGVRYFNGSISVAATDLSSAGYGVAWGQSRSWTNAFSSNNFNGLGEVDIQQPYLVQASGGSDNTIGVVSSALNTRYFDLVSGSYQAHFYTKDQLTHGTGEFILTTSSGEQVHFYDFSVSQLNQRGQFKSLIDADGNSTAVTALTSDGKIAEVQRSVTVQGTTTVESYQYAYLASPDLNAGRLASVTLRRQVNGGAWTTVRKVAYDYYDGTAQKPYGNLGDLRTATLLDGSGNRLDTNSYRYYTSADQGTIGYVHGLKYAFRPASYARLAAAVGNPLTATDTQVSPYADQYFEYEPSGTHRVTKAIVQAAGCSACTGGLGTYTYTYSTSSNANGYNSWKYKTVETQPDGTTNTVYANYVGETMLKVFQSGTNKWETLYQYDATGANLVLQANPSALTGYSESLAGLVNASYLSTNTGLLQVTDSGSSTTAGEGVAGDVAGYYKDTQLEQGSAGAAAGAIDRH